MHAHINGVEYYFEDLGDGIPLLCLSAFPYDSFMWRGMGALADIARLIIPDYRGIGRSGVTEGPTTMTKLADDMIALLDYLGIDQAVTVGDSMGGYVQFAMYARYPERVRALILNSTRPEADSHETLLRRQRTVEGLETQGMSVLRERVHELLSPYIRRETAWLVEEIQRRVAEGNAKGFAQLTLGMGLRHDHRDLLPNITVPTLVICGEDDLLTPPDAMKRMAAQIPNATFALVPHAGHLAPLEQPEAFNALVREFLRELEPQSNL